MGHRVILGVAAVLAVAGCTENAALEITLDLPPSRNETLRDGTPAERRWADVQVRRGFALGAEGELGVTWNDNSENDPIALQPGPARTIDAVTILSEDPDADVFVKIRFCIDASCTALEDDRGPETWFAIEHPFYIGERTRWTTLLSDGRTRIPAIPDAPTLDPCSPDCADFDCDTSGCSVSFVDKCAIQGCVTADGPTNFCVDGTQTHQCEAP